jgi:hypothetical protein
MFDPNANPNMDPTASQAQDPSSAYGSLDLDKQALVAQAFIQRFAGRTNDPQAQRYGAMDPQKVSADQLAEMHQYASENYPDILAEVLQHPVIADNLGGFASSELGRQAGQ